mmetsp:Transcript_2418/g.5669  ORF Transcript_2418/g.5669 Transcript_2418/m.5669 type:complete len:96 (+) Transcript_2418:201-488(+)
MPRKGLHLPLKQLCVSFRDGSGIRLRALVPAYLDHIPLQREPSIHPAWTGEESSAIAAEKDGQRSKFEKKFGGAQSLFDFGRFGSKQESGKGAEE